MRCPADHPPAGCRKKPEAIQLFHCLPQLKGICHLHYRQDIGARLSSTSRNRPLALDWFEQSQKESSSFLKKRTKKLSLI
jgi:hypothetical protein